VRAVGGSGTVLILVLGMLAMLALIATALLMAARYELVGVEGAAIENQMEMLLSMVEGTLRRTLAEDLWGSNETHSGNGSSDRVHEAYDGPDGNHPWLTGVCGRLVAWQRDENDPEDIVDYVSDQPWQALPGTGAGGLQIRFSLLVQGLGGLVNANVARRPDPDLVGQPWDVTADKDHPQRWPYSIWAFHKRRGHGDWGYWWWTPSKVMNYSHYAKDFFAGMGQPFRGGGPLSNVDLRFLLDEDDHDDLRRLDDYLRRDENYGYYLDIQDELDLRFPGTNRCGAPQTSRIEALLPSLFRDGHRRRFVTTIARTTNWQAHREPIRTRPFDRAFWEKAEQEYESDRWVYLPYPHGDSDGSAKPPFDPARWLDEGWALRIDYPHNQEMLAYYFESWLGYRMSLQRGISLSRMVEDAPLNVYPRISTSYDSPANRLHPLAPVSEFPSYFHQSWDGRRYRWRAAQAWLYDDYLTEYDRLWGGANPPDGMLAYSENPSMLVLLLANLMATAGVPPVMDPAHATRGADQATYTPRPAADTAVAKSDRVRAYRGLAGLFHLNCVDYQDLNAVPAALHPSFAWSKWFLRNRLSKYGYRTGMEEQPYISEVVIEFELWPDYADLVNCAEYSGSHSRAFCAERVDAGTSAHTRGLRVGDIIRGVRSHGSAAPFFRFIASREANHVESLRRFLADKFRAGALRPGGKIDLKLSTGKEITGIELAPAVRSIIVELHNPSFREIPLSIYNNYNDYVRYCPAVRQQLSDADAHRPFRLAWYEHYYPVESLPADGCVLFLESRGVPWDEVDTWADSRGLAGRSRHASNRFARSGQGSQRPEDHNLANLRSSGGDLILAFLKVCSSWQPFAYLYDVIREDGHPAGAPPMPVSNADPGPPAGIADAFEKARERMNAGHPFPVVRLYRPLYMESRATQFLSAWDGWDSADAGGRKPAHRLGTRGVDENDFAAEHSDDYRHIDARGFVVSSANQAFRFAADASRVSRLTHPMLRRHVDDDDIKKYADGKKLWVHLDGHEGSVEQLAPTEIIDRQLRATLSAIHDEGISSLTTEAKRLLQKAEARLRFSPYSPIGDAEKAECAAMYRFLDCFTVGGAAYDNVDNNGNGVVDEHGVHDYDLGLPPELADNDPGGAWLKEHSNCWPAYGRINVNTAPREVLEHCLLAPTEAARRKLASAIWNARGGPAGQDNDAYKPFTSLADLYTRVSVLNPDLSFGFDHYGFNGERDDLPDMPRAAYAYTDDLEERNYLWRINQELLTVRTDTFAVYLRFQARRLRDDDRWQIVAERRVYSIWDRANCIWPPKRHDARLHPDFVPAQRLGIQVFGH
jgi:hypothetical protein